METLKIFETHNFQCLMIKQYRVIWQQANQKESMKQISFTFLGKNKS